ncbi:uncharacterized protein (DUF111 family) [Desulfofundulus luciae]|uniref:Uncharacterized protein (DUF111 family) n=1 Tax=Desulfofundulus luciae TaxID=74702 RepID=A0ABU0B4Z4_9FIRM|nr:nickel insertion protein [Desulfofundulus luciae]MDQ0287786.1 uncharacterized protein (DUF111 family) [Desulfofundulus luciae]
MQQSKLIIAQVDHASGEVIGEAMQELMQLGARNVQLIQTVTKKGRPGYILFIDLPVEKVTGVATYLATELGIWGYHILDSQHIHFDLFFREKTLRLIAGEKNITYQLKVKYIMQNEKLLNIKVDHSQLVEIQQMFLEWGIYFPLRVLRTCLEAQLWSGENSDILFLRADDLPDSFQQSANFPEHCRLSDSANISKKLKMG